VAVSEKTAALLKEPTGVGLAVVEGAEGSALATDGSENASTIANASDVKIVPLYGDLLMISPFARA
jgi:hypothetical protein